MALLTLVVEKGIIFDHPGWVKPRAMGHYKNHWFCYRSLCITTTRVTGRHYLWFLLKYGIVVFSKFSVSISEYYTQNSLIKITYNVCHRVWKFIYCNDLLIYFIFVKSKQSAWFSFYLASSKTVVSPISEWKNTPNWIQYKDKPKDMNIGLYTYFLLWLHLHGTLGQTEKIHPVVSDICAKAHEQAHVGQMGKCSRCCTTTGVNTLQNFERKKSIQWFQRYAFRSMGKPIGAKCANDRNFAQLQVKVKTIS